MHSSSAHHAVKHAYINNKHDTTSCPSWQPNSPFGQAIVVHAPSQPTRWPQKLQRVEPSQATRQWPQLARCRCPCHVANAESSSAGIRPRLPVVNALRLVPLVRCMLAWCWWLHAELTDVVCVVLLICRNGADTVRDSPCAVKQCEAPHSLDFLEHSVGCTGRLHCRAVARRTEAPSTLTGLVHGHSASHQRRDQACS
jgi:hypothetical protein